MQLYEPYVDQVKQAETAAATDEAEQWDLMAPVVRQLDRIDEETGSSESAEFAAVNPRVYGRTSTYDLGIDIGLAGTSNNEELNKYDIPEEEYFKLVRSLSCQQIEFIYDTVHLAKISDRPIYTFLSGGAGTG